MEISICFFLRNVLIFKLLVSIVFTSETFPLSESVFFAQYRQYLVILSDCPF